MCDCYIVIGTLWNTGKYVESIKTCAGFKYIPRGKVPGYFPVEKEILRVDERQLNTTGWIATTSPEWSPDGSTVYVCPECQKGEDSAS